MSIANKDKDHLKQHGGVALVEPGLTPASNDPLRFWTNHPTENTIVDLHVFADGEHQNPNPTGGSTWAGPFPGRPQLILELAPALQARLALATPATCSGYTAALRLFWRVFAQLEKTNSPDGRQVEPLTSVRDLNHLHEAAAHRFTSDPQRFGAFLNVANDARKMMRLSPLLWAIPKAIEPDRQLIPESDAKTLRITIKRDWEAVIAEWARHDAIRRGEEPDTLPDALKQDSTAVQKYKEQNSKLRVSWLHLERVQQKTNRIIPATDQLLDGIQRDTLRYRGINVSSMRIVAFPTRHQADVAFHMALAGSGWNPSTLITGVDATLPERVFQHPKDAKQNVLVTDADAEATEDAEEVAMQGSKRRAGGRMQFCLGLKKNPASPPNIVATYLERTKGLREQLRRDVEDARSELKQLIEKSAPQSVREQKFKRMQALQQGLRNVWLYVDSTGEIRWLDGSRWAVYRVQDTTGSKAISYLDRVILRLNTEREVRGEPEIARVVPSDFRDIYARWVHIQSGGNVIAVMHALGHATLHSTSSYLDNNVFNAENDDAVRRFMTHLFAELEQGRVDLTILAQLVRHGPVTHEMQQRLTEYRRLMRSRINVACADVKHPPPHISPNHVEGKWCGTHLCMRKCPNARFLPESLDGISMRLEELLSMSEHMPLETWSGAGYEEELEEGEYLVSELYPRDEVDKARAHWRAKIKSGEHMVPGVGFLRDRKAA